MNQDFKFILNLTKGYKTADGRLFVEGIASGTDLDLTGERMSPEAIKSMATSLQKGIVEFRSEHSPAWDSMFGEVSELTVTPDNQLQYKAELDPGFSKSHDLLHALAKGKKLGVSIGGQVVKAGMEWVEELQRSVYTYFDIALKEISVTAQPAYAQAWVSTISKSIDRNAIDMPETTQETDVPAEEVVVGAPATVAPEAPGEAAAVVEEAAAAPAATEAPAEAVATPEVVEEAPAATDAPAESATEVEEAPESAAEPSENVQGHEEGQEAEAPVAASDPAPAEEATDKPAEETQKSQYLGEWAEADASTSVICNLSDSLSWGIRSVISDDEMDPATQTQTVDAMLTEFHAIVMRVAAALIAQDAIGDAAETGKTLQAKRTELSESLHAKTEELDAVRKSLAEMSEQLEERTTQVADLEKSLAETQAKLTEAETAKARKAIVFSKFQGTEGITDSAVEEQAVEAATAAAKEVARAALSMQAEAQTMQSFASFVTGGK